MNQKAKLARSPLPGSCGQIWCKAQRAVLMLSATDLKTEEYEPEFISNMIAAAVSHGRLRWFVTDSPCWHLDAELVHDGWRSEFVSVNEDNFDAYLNTLTEFETTSAALREYFGGLAELFDIFPKDVEGIVWDIFPTIYVNSDDRFLCVFFDEYIFSQNFCDAAPTGWRSKVHSCLELIPECERYWVVSGTDMISKYLFDWSQAGCIWDSDTCS